jgi:hypothetical protein
MILFLGLINDAVSSGYIAVKEMGKMAMNDKQTVVAHLKVVSGIFSVHSEKNYKNP